MDLAPRVRRSTLPPLEIKDQMNGDVARAWDWSVSINALVLVRVAPCGLHVSCRRNMGDPSGFRLKLKMKRLDIATHTHTRIGRYLGTYIPTDERRLRRETRERERPQTQSLRQVTTQKGGVDRRTPAKQNWKKQCRRAILGSNVVSRFGRICGVPDQVADNNHHCFSVPT